MRKFADDLEAAAATLIGLHMRTPRRAGTGLYYKHAHRTARRLDRNANWESRKGRRKEEWDRSGVLSYNFTSC